MHTSFDAHCDTIQKLCDYKLDLFENNCHIKLIDMQNNPYIQVFAAFVDKKNDMLPPFERANQLIDYYYFQTDKYQDYISH